MSWRPRRCRYIAMPRRRFARCLSYPREWGVQLLTAGAHKIGGPRGIGILYVQRGLPMLTTAFGGNQERGLRSGTEPVFLGGGHGRGRASRRARTGKRTCEARR